MPRFVLLEHDHPALHWDLMVEANGSLVTWRLSAPPTMGDVVSALHIGNHRIDYLDYEGPVSGNRGHVRRWDGGDCHWLERSERLVVVRLHGARLHGILQLQWQRGDDWQAQLRCETDSMGSA
jgi:hypothetical protein